MSREKQIEEIKKVLDGVCNVMPFGECYDVDCEICKATHLYNAGYRKQSEGEWKLGKSGCMYFCSSCNYAAHPREEEEWDFCPNCGAKMKGGAE